MSKTKHNHTNADNATPAAEPQTTQTPAPTPTPTPTAADPKRQAAKLRQTAKAVRIAAEHAPDEATKAALLTRAGQIEDDAQALDPKAEKTAKAKGEARPQCTRKLVNGEQCKQRACAGHEVCTDHRPALAHLTEAERAWLEEQLGDVHKTPNSYAARVAFVTELAGWGQVRKAAKAAGVGVTEPAKAAE